MMEITIQEWEVDAGAGMHGTPRYEELHRAAAERRLVVIKDGKRMIPVRIGDDYWTLEAEEK